ncbi:MAG: hypothetical protein Q7J07_00880 [Pelolinea sp.]|nr:hypothetical protein [Pelolinea sp.]
MNDILDKVTGESDFIKKILSKLPGFRGYVEREDRRNADKLLRESIANQYEGLWQRISTLQKNAIANGEIDKIDDLESSAIKLRQFIDRIRTATYGYAGFFDVIKVETDELNAIYQYDLQLLDLEEELSRAVDNVGSSFGTDGLPAAIRHLETLSQNSLDVFNHRKEVIVSMVKTENIGDDFTDELIIDEDEEK